MTSAQDLELKDLIARLREELIEAEKEGEGKDVRFEVEDVELEVKLVVKQVGEGKAGLKLTVFGCGIGGNYANTLENQHAQTVRLRLAPKHGDKSRGGSLRVSHAGQRPNVPDLPGDG